MNVAVIGGGSFGTALAQLIAGSGGRALLLARDREVVASINRERRNPRYFPGIALNRRLRAAPLAEAQSALQKIRMSVFAVPSGAAREVARALAPALRNHRILSTAKGMEHPSGHTVSRILLQEIPECEVGVLAGPTFAEDLIHGHACGATLGFPGREFARRWAKVLSFPSLSLDFSSDVRGVELCGVLKNIYAIAMGIFDSFHGSRNEHHLFLTLCFQEMNTLLRALAEDAALPARFCGFGDFSLTANEDFSRNRTFGLMIGKMRLDPRAIHSSIVLEGIRAAGALELILRDLPIEAPIVRFVVEGLGNSSNLEARQNRLLAALREAKLRECLGGGGAAPETSPRGGA